MNLTMAVDKVCNVFSELDREELIEWIGTIKFVLYSVCTKSSDFIEANVSAKDILDEKCSSEALRYWIEILRSAKGALKLIEEVSGRAPYYCKVNRIAFARACQDALSLSNQGYDWDEINDELLRIGMAFVYGDFSDPVCWVVWEKGKED